MRTCFSTLLGFSLGSFMIIFLLASTDIVDGATIGYMVDADAVLDQPFDQFWVSRLEEQGHDVTVFGDVELPDAVPGAELFIVSNDIGSGNVSAEFFEEERPIIVWEQALFDELAISTTGAEEPAFVIDIDNPDHPLAAGLSGQVEVYEDFQQITLIGDDWAEGVEVIASLNGIPVLSVLEQGAMDFNGDDAPGQRITIFTRDVNDGELYTDEGLALLDASVNYALGIGEGPTELQAGDADMDLDFDQLDLVRVQVAGKYLTGGPSTWGEGDWNSAPGGSQGNPPPGDGRFDQLDIIAALNADIYLKGPYAAVRRQGTAGDSQTSVGYNANTGEVWVDAPAGKDLTSVNIESASGIFTGSPAQNLGGSFDNDSDTNIFKATFGSSFGTLSFGSVAQPGLAEDFVAGDLTVVGSPAGGGDLGNVDLIYVPEPAALILLVSGLLGLTLYRRCGRENTRFHAGGP